MILKYSVAVEEVFRDPILSINIYHICVRVTEIGKYFLVVILACLSFVIFSFDVALYFRWLRSSKLRFWKVLFLCDVKFVTSIILVQNLYLCFFKCAASRMHGVFV